MKPSVLSELVLLCSVTSLDKLLLPFSEVLIGRIDEFSPLFNVIIFKLDKISLIKSSSNIAFLLEVKNPNVKNVLCADCPPKKPLP